MVRSIAINGMSIATQLYCDSIYTYILESSTDDDLEIWNESCPDSETENETPSVPQFLHTDPKKQRNIILSKWLIRFVLIL